MGKYHGIPRNILDCRAFSHKVACSVWVSSLFVTLGKEQGFPCWRNKNLLQWRIPKLVNERCMTLSYFIFVTCLIPFQRGKLLWFAFCGSTWRERERRHPIVIFRLRTILQTFTEYSSIYIHVTNAYIEEGKNVVVVSFQMNIHLEPFSSHKELGR